MIRCLAPYLLSLALMLGIDAVWLGVVSAGFYRAEIGHLLLDSPRLDAALAFYLLYALAITAMCVRPALRTGSVRRAARRGAGLGFTAYMTYDLSNLATLQGWSVKVVAADIVWGTLLTATVAALTTALLLRRQSATARG